MNYLELTNKTLEEAGIELDSLTSATFASPASTKMYTRVKNWVKDAWEDIQLENNELEFMKGIASVRVYPALLLQDGSRYGAPESGDVGTFVCASADDLELTFQSSTLLDGTWEAGTAEAIMYFTTLTDVSALNLLDSFEESGGPQDGSIGDGEFTFKYWGRYNLKDFVTDLEEANYRTFEIQDSDSNAKHKLTFIPWAIWKDQYEFSSNERGMPVYFTETPDGKVDFYPRPDKDYLLTFAYTKTLDTLAVYSDSPAMDARYHGAIVWLAVMYYANYDRQNDLWAKAQRRYLKYMFAIDRDLGPEVNFGGSQFNE